MRIAPLVFLCLTLLVTACGDDDTSEPTPASDTVEDSASADSATVNDVTASDVVTVPGDANVDGGAGDVVSPTDATSAQDVNEDVSSGDATTDVGAPDTSASDAGASDAAVDVSTPDVTEDAQTAEDVAGDAEALPEWACTAEQGCEDPGAMCIGPEEQLCGICFEVDNPCVDDGQCDAGTVCAQEPHPCSCSGEKDCIAPCIPGDACGSGKQCDAGGHCVAQACGQDADCPSNFACANAACERVTCKASSECDDYCVKGSCFAIPGNCGYPPP